MTYLEKECSESYLSDTCVAFTVQAIICTALFLFGIYCCISVVKFNKKITFEFFPIFISLIMSVMLFFHSFYEKNIKIDLTSQYLEISLFWAITYAIAEIYYTVKPNQYQSRKILRNIYLGNIVFLSIFLILGLFGIPRFECESRYSFQFYFVSAQQLFIAITCIIYSRKLIKEIRIEEVEESDNRQKIRLQIQSTEQLYYQERVNQLKMVIFTLILSSFIDLLLDLITQVVWKNDFKCISHYNYIPETSLAKIDSFISFLLKAIPSLMIPYIFYVLPIRNRSQENIDIQEEPLQQQKKQQKHLFVDDPEDEEEDDEEQQHHHHQQQISEQNTICPDPINCSNHEQHNINSINQQIKKKNKSSKSWFQAADDLKRLKRKIICKSCNITQNNCESECGSDTCIKKDKIDSFDFAHQKIKSGIFSKSFTEKYAKKDNHIHDHCDD